MRAGVRLSWRLATVVAFGATAALAVASSRGAPGETALASASGAAAPPAVARVIPLCAASRLRISVGPGARLTAVVVRYAVDFTNVSAAPCTLAGYPEVVAYQGDGAAVGDSAAPDTTVAASRVLLAPGKTAHASLDAALALPRCRPVRAAGLRVVVSPGQPAVRYVRPMTACAARAVRGQDYLHVRAIQAGTGTA
jgi:Protein of unknown function (DUF4232)